MRLPTRRSPTMVRPSALVRGGSTLRSRKGFLRVICSSGWPPTSRPSAQRYRGVSRGRGRCAAAQQGGFVGGDLLERMAPDQPLERFEIDGDIGELGQGSDWLAAT